MKKLPEMVDDYNHHMMGVDRMDQMMSYYSFQRKSIKWWRKVFFWVMEVMVNNAHVIYKAHTTTSRKLTMKEFRRELAVELCRNVVRSETGVLCHDHTLERLHGRHFPDKISKRKDCRVCSDRNPGGARRVVNTVCATCSEKPALCLGECFRIYHTRPTI